MFSSTVSGHLDDFLYHLGIVRYVFAFEMFFFKKKFYIHKTLNHI